MGDDEIGAQFAEDAGRGFVSGAIAHIEGDAHPLERAAAGEAGFGKLHVAAERVIGIPEGDATTIGVSENLARCVVRSRGNAGVRVLGPYLSTFASSVPTILYGTLLAGQYTTPAIYCEVTAVFTNTAPVDAYRGAGRPETTYVVERLRSAAARELKISDAEIRRRNFIRTFPYQTPVALCYDTGNYEATLSAALYLMPGAASSSRAASSTLSTSGSLGG